ncbi:MAG: class I SAM-dependent methyltransferase [Cyclobacteriaceae bacterium]|nr:class I SAM-dependent methyltransferase [Cyclobacteriaceae bacterium]
MTNYEEVKLTTSKFNIQYFDNIKLLNMHFTLDSLSKLDESEDKHFWHKNRKHLLKLLIKKFVRNNDFSLADIGCGNGSIISFLEKAYSKSKITGIDGHLNALINVRRRTKKAVLQLQDISQLESIDQSSRYDIVILMDVLEHLDKPDKILDRIKNVLKTDGIIIATVPALMNIWSDRDVFLEHRIRYSKNEFTQLFKNSGYKVLKSNYFFSHLFVPTYLLRKLFAKFTNKSGQKIEQDELRIIPLLNGILKFIGDIEMYISTFLSLPFGTSTYCVAKKNVD